MKIRQFVFCLLTLIGCLLFASREVLAETGSCRTETEFEYSMEMDINRAGEDYKDLDLENPDPKLCAEACAADTRCKAWTMVKPGIQAEGAKCWLKDKAPPPTPDENCISGVKP